MIFAAGLGTRLKSLTKTIPKALVKVNGKAMLERVILRLKQAGVTDIIINLHHFPQQIEDFLAANKNFGLNIVFSHEIDQPLETGGGLLNAARFFDDGKPFFVHNSDILTDLDLKEMMDFHLRNDNLATLFVQQRHSTRYLHFDDTDLLSGWINKKTGEEIEVKPKTETMRELAFNGIHIIDPKLFSMINERGKFSIIPVYLELAKTQIIRAFEKNDVSYLDIGKPESLAKAEAMVKKWEG
jgi:NDP-sugar pyrophosphorylase family protein